MPGPLNGPATGYVTVSLPFLQTELATDLCVCFFIVRVVWVLNMGRLISPSESSRLNPVTDSYMENVGFGSIQSCADSNIVRWCIINSANRRNVAILFD